MLEVRNFSSGYGRTSVLHDIDLVVRPGEIVALIGANGAGKSTLVRTLIGLLPVRSGSIVLTGEPIEALSTTARMRRGLCLVPEGRQIFGGLTIEANLRLGAYVSKVNGDADWESRIQSACKSFPVLLDRRHELAANLSGGQQQMLAIARGLMSGPTLLLLDEPSLGLAPSLVSEIFRLIAELRASGISILLSEQNARRSLAISDRAYVIENGRIVTTGAAAELAQRPDIAEAYLGVGHDLRLGDHHLAIAEKLRSILG